MKMTASKKRAPAKKAPAKKIAKPTTPWQKWVSSPEASLTSLCDKIKDGKTLTAIAAELGAGRTTLLGWIEADPDRSARAREARSTAAAAYDDMALDGIEEANDPFELARAKERAHHLRWRASKVNPKEYGDKVELGGEVGIKALPDEQLWKRAEGLAQKLGISLGTTGSVSGPEKSA